MTRTVETFEEAVERFIAAAEAQGFGRYVTDPAVLDRIAGILLSQRDDAPSARTGRRPDLDDRSGKRGSHGPDY